MTTMACLASLSLCFKFTPSSSVDPRSFRCHPRTVHLSVFPYKTSSTLNFLHNIPGVSLLFPERISTVASPARNSQPLTVACANKRYKMKTHKASAKRFRVTGTGKIIRRKAGKQHLLRKKNAKRRNRLSKMVQVARSDYNNVVGVLPYLKVNRKN